MALVPITAYGNSLTSLEVAFLQNIADHSYTDGQLAIGNSSTGGISFNTLTQGSGITITNGNGTITIAGSGSAAAITVGTTTITSGTNTNILFDNSGVLGEYTISGSGTVVAMATSPTFITSIIDPLVIGGTGVGASLSLQSTSGVGTTDFIRFLVGNNGGTEAMRIIDSGNIGIGVVNPSAALIQTGGTNTNQLGLYLVHTQNSALTASQWGIFQDINFTPSGASLSNLYGMMSSPVVSGGSTSISIFYGYSANLSTTAGYTGQVSAAISYFAFTPTIAGSLPFSTYTGLQQNAVTNGNGITTGTITNRGILINPFTAAAGSGGTINNYGAQIGVPSASSVGTNNRGLYITGNGGASANTNYALYSDSTAASYFAGNVGIGTTTPTNFPVEVAGAIGPHTNDAGALGSATLSWSDLFLASGAVLNYANSNVVITHTSGILTMGTGDFQITTAGTNAASVVTVGGTQTLTNKTLTSPILTTPQFADLGYIKDANGNELLIFDSNSGAVNQVQIFNAPTTGGPGFVATGDDTNINLDFQPKGTGRITMVGVKIPTVSSTDTLTNKTLTAPAMTTVAETGIGTADLLASNNNTITVTSNAGSASQSFLLNTFTNSSAATMAITIPVATPTPKDGQFLEVRIYDFSGVAETIGWTNTENSTVTAPTTSNGSTTLPLSVLFQFNAATSKWRCIATA